MGRFLRSGGLLYFIILMVLAVILVHVLAAGNASVKELNSQQYLAAEQKHEFVVALSGATVFAGVLENLADSDRDIA